MKSRTGLILGLLAAVLIFFISIPQIITAGAVLLRVVIVFCLGYLLGMGLDFFFKLYVRKVVEKNEPATAFDLNTNADSSPSDSDTSGSAAVKGGRVDYLAGASDDLSEPPSASSGQGTETPSSPASAEDIPETPPRPHTVLEKKFEINDKYILIDDKKLPNNPEMIASAIKTKLGE